MTDPYGMDNREDTIAGLKAQLAAQKAESEQEIRLAYIRGEASGRRTRQASEERRRWCLEYAKIYEPHPPGLIELAKLVEEYLAGEK